MGRTPRELGAALTSAEMTEFLALDLVEPFGQKRTDDGFRLLACLLYNSNRGKDQPALMPSDFLGVWEPVAPKDPELQMREVEAFLERRVED